MPTYTYSQNADLFPVAKALLDKRSAANPFMKSFPIRETPYSMVMWEREDITKGLIQGRGYNGAFPNVPGLGSTRKVKQPGVYGEVLPIDELEMTTRAQYASFNAPIGIDDLVMRRVKQGMTRLYNRMVHHYVTLLTTGRYVATDAKGAVIDEDAYAPQTYNPAILWSTSATATPQQDFRNAALLDLGISTAFNETSIAVMNQTTFNAFITNTNANDLGGRRTNFGSTVNAMADLNALQQRDGLPQIVVWNESYIDSTGTAQRFMPNGKVAIIGQREDGEPLGEFLLTKNVNNRDAGSQVHVYVKDEPDVHPRKIEVFTGFNGGIAVYVPESIIIMTVL